jgi:hypothetical protein
MEPLPMSPNPPALLTALASRQPLVQIIPAWMMGYLILKRRVILFEKEDSDIFFLTLNQKSMQKILQEVKKLTNNQKLKLYNTLQKDLYLTDNSAKKELSPDQWKTIGKRLSELESGKVKGITLNQHLQWLKQRRNAS